MKLGMKLGMQLSPPPPLLSSGVVVPPWLKAGVSADVAGVLVALCLSTNAYFNDEQLNERLINRCARARAPRRRTHADLLPSEERGNRPRP